MYYMISPIPFEDYKKYHIPFLVGNRYGRNYNGFYETEEGKEFRSIAPVRMYYQKNKRQMLFDIAMDICWIGCCYNCPLHVYIMKDKVFHNELDLGYMKYTNFGKCKAMEGTPKDKDYSMKLPRNEMYFQGNMSEVEKHVHDVMKFKLNNDTPIIHYIVYKDRIEVCDYER